MRSGALSQLMIAEALRACIRAVGLYGDVRGRYDDFEASNGGAGGLVRELVADNAVRGIARELARITACGDLAAPITTFAEATAREQRLRQLERSLPTTHSLLDTARGMVGLLPDGVLTESDGRLLLPVRGHLVSMDEAQIRAAQERFQRLGRGAANARAQARYCIELLHNEASAWRMVDTSDLADRLLADRGFLDTYGQARKRARAVLRAHTEADGDILRPAELQELLRWHRSVVGQLELRAGGADWEQLRTECVELEALLDTSLQILRLWKVLGGAAGAKRRRQAKVAWPTLVESLTVFLRKRSAECLAALPRVYGLSKSNFRTLVGSETRR